MLSGGEMTDNDDEMKPEFMRGRVAGAPKIMPPVTNSDGYRGAEIPAANGHGNARSVVRAQTAVANGGSAFGVDLISPKTIEQIFREQGEVAGMGATHGIGYAVSSPLFASLMPEDVKMSFWGGMGGSTIILDHTNRVCMSYVMNQMDLSLLGAERGANLTGRFYEGLAGS